METLEQAASRKSISIEGANDGPFNMARDAAMLQNAEQNAAAGARIYKWNGLWISLGKNQNCREVLSDPDACRWVVRPTGGKAVWHNGDVTVSIAAPLSAIGCAPREAKEVYRILISPIVSALCDAGIDACLGENLQSELRDHPSQNCFLSRSPNDVLDRSTGRKIVGCALRITRRAVLAQCSIPPMENFDQTRFIEHLAVRLQNHSMFES
jgi:lipoate-protein ligase A